MVNECIGDLAPIHEHSRPEGRLSGPILQLSIYQILYAPLHIVPYRTHIFDTKSLRIAERPVVAPKTGDIWAFVPAAHRDEELCTLRQLFRELLGLRVAEVDANLLHDGRDFRMNALSRFRAG